MGAIGAQVRDSRRQHLKAKREKFKSEGHHDYESRGYLEDVRWKKEAEDKDEDGNVKRIQFLKKLKLDPFTALEQQTGRALCS